MPGQPSARPIVPPPLPSRGGARTPVPTLSTAPIPTLAAAPIPTLAPAAPSTHAAVPAPPGALDPFAPFALTPVPLGPFLERVQTRVWPATVVPAAGAEGLLADTLRGAPVSGTVAEVAIAARVAKVLSPDERAALTGGPVAHDPSLLRAAAALRLRLELALATVPAAGAPFDGPAAQALLGEVDAVLALVKAAAAAAEPALAASLEPIRLALVDGGVDFANRLSRRAPAEAAAALPAIRASAARLLSNVNAADLPPMERGRKGAWVVLGLVVAVTAAYHGHEFMTRQPQAPLPVAPGAPAHTFVVTQGRVRMLLVEPGFKVSASDLEVFRAREQVRGEIVRNVGPGSWVIEPGDQPATGAKP